MRNTSIQRIGQILGTEIDSKACIMGYRIDSRFIEEGDLFFALKGEKVDGVDFLQEASQKKAIAAVVPNSYKGLNFGLILLKVEDVVKALHQLTYTLMLDCKAIVVAITGSLGKTTTREFTALLLEEKFKVLRSEKNYNTKLTYPQTLLNRRGDEEVLVVEMGMSEPGGIGKLVDIWAPDIAVITKIANVHACYFPRGILDIAIGKAEIFKSDKTKLKIFDSDLLNYQEIKLKGKTFSFSTQDPKADLYWSFEKAYEIDLPIQAPHILHNFLAAASVCLALGMSLSEIFHRAKYLSLPSMRLEKMVINDRIFINDAYNANVDSMKAALTYLKSFPSYHRKIAILGWMVELGALSDTMHQEVGKYASDCADILITFGKNALLIHEAFEKGCKYHFETIDQLNSFIIDFLKPQDVVLLKGSRAVGLERVLNYFKNNKQNTVTIV